MTLDSGLLTDTMATIRTQKEIRKRAPLVLIGLLFTNLVLMSVSARDTATNQSMIRVWTQALVSPFQRVTTGAGNTGLGVFQSIASVRNAVTENATLRQRVEAMDAELRNARAAVDENDRLKNLLDLKEHSKYGVATARVIARDTSAWFDTVVINRGSASGVQLNMPVVTPGGIVGRVVATSPWTAQVRLITDEKSGAGAVVGQLGQSSALGSVKGLGENGLVEMRYVSGLETVNEGDYVVTTGQDGIYPPGFNVGTVVQVTKGSATQPHVIRIKPGARLDSLEEVAVLLYHPPQREAMEQALPNVDKGKRK
ncbi:MAG: rod shape-determining protein MreC [Pyrinomonadaceae bacterium]